MRRRSAMLAALSLLGACDRVLGLDELPDEHCYGKNGPDGTGLLRVCFTATDDLVLPVSLSTGHAANAQGASDPGDCRQVLTQTDAAKTEVCVMTGKSIHIVSPIQLSGSRPLVFAASEDLLVAADLDASSPGLLRGPGGSFSGCPELTGGNAGGNMRGAGGGAGGSFGGVGGDGGSGDGVGAMAVPEPMPGFVRGGCDGGRGGAGAGSGGPGNAGRGGGALYLIAGDTITIRGTLHASGGGGGGGGRASPNSQTSGGGGGGGSGGLIGLDAPRVVLEPTAVLVANGGGGGGGGGGYNTGGVTTTVGTAGGDVSLLDMAPFTAAGGASGLPGGGTGGTGGARDHAAMMGDPHDVTGGGGGGGGGEGRILVFTGAFDDQGATASPAIVP